MNKIVKGAVIGIIGYGLCNLSFDLGKAYTLGAMLKLEMPEAQECYSALSTVNRLRVKFIVKTASIFSKVKD